ncbi:MAG: hypothetical protein PHZ00_00960 [Candidatus Peribacteraceae bacterium]|nr:hypothetical protein [Candidatus Peribacteraceae bacterium]
MLSSDLHQERVSALLKAINRSLLLSEVRKRQLRQAIPTLGEAALDDLAQILESEQETLNGLFSRAIAGAVERHDQAFLTSLDSLLRTARKTLRQGQERAEQEEDLHNTHSSFLDAA